MSTPNVFQLDHPMSGRSFGSRAGGIFAASSRRAARAATLSWLTWQVAGLGPMGGQASHFLRYAPAGQDYAIDRYTKEVKRLLTVLENGWRRVPMSRATIIRSPTWRSGRAALPHS